MSIEFQCQHDVPMDSPSGIILGRPSNGWDDWKDADGNKLGEIIKRQKSGGESKRTGLGSPTENYVRSADAIELKPLYVGHICLKHVIG